MWRKKNKKILKRPGTVFKNIALYVLIVNFTPPVPPAQMQWSLKTCIFATDVVTCVIAIESVSYIVPTETALFRIDYIQKLSLAEMVSGRDPFSCNKGIDPMSKHQV